MCPAGAKGAGDRPTPEAWGPAADADRLSSVPLLVKEGSTSMLPGSVAISAVSLVVLVGGCRSVISGVDPEPLGYGPGPAAGLASGYDPNPVPRPAPTPWTPPPRHEASPMSLGEMMEASEPIEYAADVVEVCEHLATFDASTDREACLRSYRIARVFRTIGDWKTLAACIAASSDAAAVAACEQATPPAFGPVAEYPRESAVCMHVFTLTILEQIGPQPMLDTPALLEFQPLLHNCVDSLVVEERADRNPAEYVEMLDCIERARTSTAAEACE
jgi:hypothetical protein